jgi:hypothetical protein
MEQMKLTLKAHNNFSSNSTLIKSGLTSRLLFGRMMNRLKTLHIAERRNIFKKVSSSLEVLVTHSLEILPSFSNIKVPRKH